MKVLVTADIHLTNKPYTNSLELGKQLLKDLVRVATNEGCTHIVIVGDLWDQKHATPVDVLLAIRYWLEYEVPMGLKVHWVRGNHECQSRTNPEESLIVLFDGITECGPYNYYGNWGDHDVEFHFLPWYPTAKLKEQLMIIHEKAMRQPKKRHFLFAHCGLREGKVNADGFTVPTDLSVKHLQPELYSFVLLGDYHGHQFLADNVLYVGEPVPRTFGSFNTVGVWVLDISEQEVKLESRELPSRYPKFVTTHISSKELLGTTLDPFDRNKVICPADLLPAVTARYPYAEVVPIPNKEEAPRSAKVYLSDHNQVLKEYIDRHYPKEDKTFYATARSYLEAAKD